jgi:plasmid stabilization system protein ParE
MGYEVVRSNESDRDLELIFDHLEQSYLSLGDPPKDAVERAASKIMQIEDEMEKLGHAPFQGTLVPEILPDLRRVTKHNTIYYFFVHEETKTLRILAIFFGGQNHIVHMLNRLLGE